MNSRIVALTIMTAALAPAQTWVASSNGTIPPNSVDGGAGSSICRSNTGSEATEVETHLGFCDRDKVRSHRNRKLAATGVAPDSFLDR